METDAVVRELSIKTGRREELVNITKQVNHEIQAAGIQAGLCHLTVLHTTAAILVNEAESGLVHDLLGALDRLVPVNPDYAHPDGNAHAHIKAAVIGASKTLSIHNGRLLLGTWQSVFLIEFDGPRERKLTLQLIPA
ncbi:MAG: secondary thiamine-phosphate synthase enzyme YjbQ [Nitrospirota bacterium]